MREERKIAWRHEKVEDRLKRLRKTKCVLGSVETMKGVSANTTQRE